jgi:hypothetical protein
VSIPLGVRLKLGIVAGVAGPVGTLDVARDIRPELGIVIGLPEGVEAPDGSVAGSEEEEEVGLPELLDMGTEEDGLDRIELSASDIPGPGAGLGWEDGNHPRCFFGAGSSPRAGGTRG